MLVYYMLKSSWKVVFWEHNTDDIIMLGHSIICIMLELVIVIYYFKKNVFKIMFKKNSPLISEKIELIFSYK